MCRCGAGVLGAYAKLTVVECFLAGVLFGDLVASLIFLAATAVVGFAFLGPLGSAMFAGVDGIERNRYRAAPIIVAM